MKMEDTFKRRLFVIGNGFDLAHELPTKFDPDFKEIAKKHETYCFWDIYQTQDFDIWSDFENLLARPDFNSLEKLFDGYTPDYLSDKERDRNGSIIQVHLNGNLQDALEEFANQADETLNKLTALPLFIQLFDSQDIFINFNYTHTLEKLYNIEPGNVLHIHGEVGENNLLLGYTEGEFSPEKYSYNVGGKREGPYREIEISEYIDDIEDYYIRAAYSKLLDKTKSFSKETKLNFLRTFLDNHNALIEQIIVYGHSCAIDFSYFDYLNKQYPDASWVFYVRENLSSTQRRNVKLLVKNTAIKNYIIKAV